MGDTRDYLDHFARRTADNVAATVEERNDDGTYMVREISSKALQRAARATVDEYTVGERVMISRPAASRNVVGSQPVIISRAPREQRGLSATSPAETRNYVDRTAIISVDPDPVELEAGGDGMAITITGIGLGGAAPSFAATTADAPAPVITIAEDPVPVLTDAQVVVTLAADADSPLGDFDVIVNGARAAGAVRVVEARAEPSRLWALGYDDVDFNPHLFRLVVNDPGIVLTDTFLDAPDDYTVTDLDSYGGAVAVKMGSHVAVLDPEGAVISMSAAQNTTGFSQTGADGEGLLYVHYPTGTTLARFDVIALAEATWALGGSSTFQPASVNVDGEHAWIATGARLIKWDIAMGAEVAEAAFTDAVELASDGAHVFVMYSSGSERRIAKVHRDTLAEIANTAVGTDAITPGITQLHASADALYGTIRDADGNRIFKVDPGTLSVTAVSSGTDAPAGLVAFGGSLLVAFSNAGEERGGVLIYDAETMALSGRFIVPGCGDMNRLLVV